MAVGSFPGLDFTMALGGRTGHSDGHHWGCRVVLGHQHGPRWRSRAWASLAFSGTRSLRQQHRSQLQPGHRQGQGSSPGPDVTMALPHQPILHCLHVFRSAPPRDRNHSASLSHIPPCICTIMVSFPPPRAKGLSGHVCVHLNLPGPNNLNFQYKYAYVDA